MLKFKLFGAVLQTFWICDSRRPVSVQAYAMGQEVEIFWIESGQMLIVVVNDHFSKHIGKFCKIFRPSGTFHILFFFSISRPGTQ